MIIVKSNIRNKTPILLQLNIIFFKTTFFRKIAYLFSFQHTNTIRIFMLLSISLAPIHQGCQIRLAYIQRVLWDIYGVGRSLQFTMSVWNVFLNDCSKLGQLRQCYADVYNKSCGKRASSMMDGLIRQAFYDPYYLRLNYMPDCPLHLLQLSTLPPSSPPALTPTSPADTQMPGSAISNTTSFGLVHPHWYTSLSAASVLHFSYLTLLASSSWIVLFKTLVWQLSKCLRQCHINSFFNFVNTAGLLSHLVTK